MYHGLENQFLYAAYRVEANFEDATGQEIRRDRTGFFVKSPVGQVWFITNRHMVDLPFSHAKYHGSRLVGVTISGKLFTPGTRSPDVPFSAPLTSLDFRFSQDPTNDVACVPARFPQHGQLVEFVVPFKLLATRELFATKLQVCDFLAFPGFPPWYDHVQDRPILRTGTIASDPRYNYSFAPKPMGDCLAYEAFSYGGSSGSPVFAVQKGPMPGNGIHFAGYRELLLIGINAGHLPAQIGEHSGISYLYKSYIISDLLTS